MRWLVLFEVRQQLLGPADREAPDLSLRRIATGGSRLRCSSFLARESVTLRLRLQPSGGVGGSRRSRTCSGKNGTLSIRYTLGVDDRHHNQCSAKIISFWLLIYH